MRKFRRVQYSPDVDALVVTFSDEKPEYGEDVGENFIIHFSKGGRPVEVEILDASQLVISSMEAIALKAQEKTTPRTK